MDQPWSTDHTVNKRLAPSEGEQVLAAVMMSHFLHAQGSSPPSHTQQRSPLERLLDFAKSYQANALRERKNSLLSNVIIF